jgi:hypothetical protein
MTRRATRTGDQHRRDDAELLRRIEGAPDPADDRAAEDAFDALAALLLAERARASRCAVHLLHDRLPRRREAA